MVVKSGPRAQPADRQINLGNQGERTGKVNAWVRHSDSMPVVSEKVHCLVASEGMSTRTQNDP
jgi:hypothetical protein